jgi:hypothetical protein
MLFDLFNVLGLAGIVAGTWAFALNLKALRAASPDLRKMLLGGLMVGAGLGALFVLLRYPYGEEILGPPGRTRWIIGFPFAASRDAGDILSGVLAADALVGLLTPQLALRFWFARAHAAGPSARAPSRSLLDYVALIGTLVVAVGYGFLIGDVFDTLQRLHSVGGRIVEASHRRLVYITPVLAAAVSCVLALTWLFRKGATPVVRVLWAVALVAAVLAWPLFFIVTAYGSASHVPIAWP